MRNCPSSDGLLEPFIAFNYSDIMSSAAFGVEVVKAFKKEAMALVKGMGPGKAYAVKGTTGCGKSTGIPQMQHECFPLKNIVVTQPRVLAACELADRVTSEQGWQLGHKVGYITGLSQQVSKQSKIVYMTDEILQLRTPDQWETT